MGCQGHGFRVTVTGRRGRVSPAVAPGGLPGSPLTQLPVSTYTLGGNEIKPQIYMSYAMPVMAVSTALREMCKVPRASVHFAVAQCGNPREAHNLSRSRLGGGRGRPPEPPATGRAAGRGEAGRKPRGSAPRRAGWLPAPTARPCEAPRAKPTVRPWLDGATLQVFWLRRETLV